MSNNKKKDPAVSLVCSFCGKNQEIVKKLVAGPGVYICDECVELCNEMLAEDIDNDFVNTFDNLAKPKEIKDVLDQYVIGQDQAKKILSVAVYNHYKRIFSNKNMAKNEVELEKSNILLAGPSGSGKTLLAQTLAKMLKVPFAIVDATSLTEAGYVGEDVENILLRLIQNADGDIKKAEIGIIYIDEIDKISRKSDNPSITRDVSGEGVQQALLKIIEGTVANVPPQGGRKHPHQEFLSIDTRNILFILGGAFIGLDKIVQSRLGNKTMGFGADVQSHKEIEQIEITSNINPEDFIKYGLIPEFIGRVPMIAHLHELDKNALVRVLTEPRNSLIKQYEKIFFLEGIEIKFEDKAIEEIVSIAMERKTGARGLRSVLEQLMLDLMYDAPSNNEIEKIIITSKMVKQNEKPKIKLKKKEKSA